MRERLRSALPALASLVLFVIALEVLRHEMRAVSWRTLLADVLGAPRAQLAAAMLLTFLNYAVLTGYDFIAFAYIRRPLPATRVAIVAFLSYAIANNVGFAIISGASVRYRFYTRWGVTAEELSRIVFSNTVTFWLGLMTLGGLSLAVGPLKGAHDLPASSVAAPLGWLLVAASAVYLLLAAFRREPLRAAGIEFPFPPVPLAATQLAISIVDWTLAAAVFYVLLPPGGASFLTVLGAFLAAQLFGLASHVPGGVGVFEGLIVLLLQPFYSSGQLLPVLVVYRGVYYLLPLAVALVALVVDEVVQRRVQAARATKFLARVSQEFTPRLLAIFAFIGGLVLLFSGATPAAQGRLALLDRVLPLGVIETSHFVGSLVGAALLLLSQGLARRLDAAYYLTATAIWIGIAASLLKGADIEEATFLAVLLVLLRRAKPDFDRKAALLETRFSAAWIASVVAALTTSIWLGRFAFKHIEFSQDLWWQFELNGEASRALRGSVGAATVVLLFAIARLIRHAPHEADMPADSDLEAVPAAIAAQTSTYPYLIYLRDKALLFNPDRSGFIMYAIQGRTWVAMGDPVGPRDAVADLVRQFLERADDFGGTPVFYEVRKEFLHHYADFGLAFVKLGEAARVDLRQFTLEGGQASRWRQSVRRSEKAGAAFRMVPAGEAAGLLPQLQAVSDDWLADKKAAEKGFSLGFFDPAYVARFPVGVIEAHGRVLAFANLWPGPGKEELSIDLMRYHHDAPDGVMETLIVQLLTWGKANGYRWFALGMAPMSGFEQSPVAPLWSRLGIFLYDHGEALYNFQGLRAYKEKFHPVWEPQYLAYPGGLTLPRILTDVSALVAGGYRKIFLK
jgi:phosphatidylglycerol lysyltransferase